MSEICEQQCAECKRDRRSHNRTQRCWDFAFVPKGNRGGQVKQTEAQILLAVHLKELGIATVAEYRFDPERDWRADLASLEMRILFECDGGQFRGGHKRSMALEGDYEKQNEAQAQGWKIFRFTNRQILTGSAYDWVKSWMRREHAARS